MVERVPFTPSSLRGDGKEAKGGRGDETRFANRKPLERQGLYIRTLQIRSLLLAEILRGEQLFSIPIPSISSRQRQPTYQHHDHIYDYTSAHHDGFSHYQNKDQSHPYQREIDSYHQPDHPRRPIPYDGGCYPGRHPLRDPTPVRSPGDVLRPPQVQAE